MKKILPAILLLAAACSDEISPASSRTPPSTVSMSSSAPQPPTIKGPKLMPVDQAWLDASFVTFRSNLLEVVRRRDTQALLAAIDPKIRTSFGPRGGKNDFQLQWLLDQPDSDSPLWQELELILTHGGTFNAGAPQPQFWAPYVYSAWPESHDSFESLAVIVGRAPLHEANSASSPVLATLSYDIVKLEPEKAPARAPIERETWKRVATADGRLGWVESRFVRSPIDYRAGFSKNGDLWKMDALFAGD